MVKKSKSSPIINRDNGDFDKCHVCKEPLKNVRHLRSKPKMCASCRGDKVGGNSAIRQMFLETQKNPTEPAEDEMWFDDDLKASKEEDHQRYFPKVRDVSFGGSGLADMMSPSDTNRYRNKKEQNQ
jgi:hypothetical protein